MASNIMALCGDKSWVASVLVFNSLAFSRKDFVYALYLSGEEW